MSARVVLLAPLLIAFGAACGDVYAEPGAGPPPESAVFQSDASAVFPRELPSSCPAQRPQVNAPCSVPGSTCEYGASPDMQCNRVFACVAGVGGNAWLERPSDRCLARACPKEPADTLTLDGRPCDLGDADAGAITDADEVVCPMSNGICACTTGPDGAHAHARQWVCVRPTTADCRARRPRAGEACSGDLWCDYGSCKFKRGVLMQCTSGIWLTGGASCN